jgi:internalin A
MSRRKGKPTNASDKLVLKSDVIGKYLADFSYAEGYQGMQFVRLNLASKKVENLDKALLEYSHLKFIDLFDNNIVDVSIFQTFGQLVHLNLSKNKLKNLNAFTGEEVFPNLRKLELSHNNIAELVPITAAKLEFLDISSNKIEKQESWTGNPTIKVFLANDNKFKSLGVIKDMPVLEHANLESNPINSFKDYDNVAALKILNLKDSKIDKIEEEIPEMASIEELNLSNSKINSIDNLKHIFQFGTLKNLDIQGTPLEQQASSFNMLMAELVNIYHGLTHFCRVEITDQHKYESLYLSEYRWRKAEEERIRKEEEERLKAEAEGGD